MGIRGNLFPSNISKQQQQMSSSKRRNTRACPTSARRSQVSAKEKFNSQVHSHNISTEMRPCSVQFHCQGERRRKRRRSLRRGSNKLQGSQRRFFFLRRAITQRACFYKTSETSVLVMSLKLPRLKHRSRGVSCEAGRVFVLMKPVSVWIFHVSEQ